MTPSREAQHALMLTYQSMGLEDSGAMAQEVRRRFTKVWRHSSRRHRAAYLLVAEEAAALFERCVANGLAKDLVAPQPTPPSAEYRAQNHVLEAWLFAEPEATRLDAACQYRDLLRDRLASDINLGGDVSLDLQRVLQKARALAEGDPAYLSELEAEALAAAARGRVHLEHLEVLFDLTAAGTIVDVGDRLPDKTGRPSIAWCLSQVLGQPPGQAARLFAAERRRAKLKRA